MLIILIPEPMPPEPMSKESENIPGINWNNLGWVIFIFLVMSFVIAYGELWSLTFLHVFFGLLWTGIDLFMGFVLGPVLRQVTLPVRKAILLRMMPRTLFILPTVAIVTGTTGYFLAQTMGYLDLDYPEFWWVAAALLLLFILTVQGLGYLLPTNYRVYSELRAEQPDVERIGRLMRLYFWVVASQGVMQIVMIVIMTKFGTGL